jgi:hypothetical protein
MEAATSPIFIIGSGRSGTTLIRNMLNAHPRIHIAFEPHFYWYESLYRRRASARQFLDYYFQTTHFRWQRVDPERVLAGLPDPLPRDQLGAAYAAIMREKAARYGRVRFGEKTPAHAASLPRIFEDFPDARAIHIVRDPRGAAQSLAGMPWAPGSLMVNACYLDLERKQVAKFLERMLRLRLEDLLAEPRATMERVLKFVGEPWDDSVLDHAGHLPDKQDTPPYPWLEGASRDRAAPGAQWRSLTPREIRMIERITRLSMAEAGYEPAKLDDEPSRLAVWWTGLRQIPDFIRYLAVTIPLALRARDPRNLDAVESALLRRVNPRAWARYPGYVLPIAPSLQARGLPPALPSLTPDGRAP